MLFSMCNCCIPADRLLIQQTLYLNLSALVGFFMWHTLAATWNVCVPFRKHRDAVFLFGKIPGRRPYDLPCIRTVMNHMYVLRTRKKLTAGRDSFRNRRSDGVSEPMTLTRVIASDTQSATTGLKWTRTTGLTLIRRVL